MGKKKQKKKGRAAAAAELTREEAHEELVALEAIYGEDIALHEDGSSLGFTLRVVPHPGGCWPPARHGLQAASPGRRALQGCVASAFGVPSGGVSLITHTNQAVWLELNEHELSSSAWVCIVNLSLRLCRRGCRQLRGGHPGGQVRPHLAAQQPCLCWAFCSMPPGLCVHIAA